MAPEAPDGGEGARERAPMTSISELVLEVSDLERSRRFYREVLGLEETFYGEGREGRVWYLIGDSARLGLWTPQTGIAGGRGGAHVHFAMHVASEDFDGMAARLHASGEPVEGPIYLGPWRSIYVTDPDGHSVEVWEQPMDEYTQGARAGGGPGTWRT